MFGGLVRVLIKKLCGNVLTVHLNGVLGFVTVLGIRESKVRDAQNVRKKMPT